MATTAAAGRAAGRSSTSRLALALLVAAAIARPTAVRAQAPDPCPGAATVSVAGDSARTVVACADPVALRGICDDVYKNFDAPAGSPFRYQYEEKLYLAAGADPLHDSLEVVRAKIGRMWRALEDPHLKCDAANFDVPRGSIVKYAVKMQNFRFVAYVAQKLRVPLNAVDRSDGLTLLDYVEQEIERTRGTETETSLRTYHRVLREAGALTRAELGG